MSMPRCGKCLLSEFDMKFYAETVADYISLIPPEKRSDENEYGRRLEVCRRCPRLTDGMCGECGCFVEIRAAKAAMSCPVRKWECANAEKGE